MGGIAFEYAPGATPLDPDEAEDLIPAHITTQGQLNAWELANIVDGRRWALNPRRRSGGELLSEGFVRVLHERMFDKTWRWAGNYRATEKSIGAPPEQIAVRLHNLLEDVRAQIGFGTYAPDEIAARFHHRLVAVHPFPNGNGRHARLMTDLLLRQLGRDLFTWGAADLAAEGDVRRRYIDALRLADARDYSALLAFVRS